MILTNDGAGTAKLYHQSWNGWTTLPNMTSRNPALILSEEGVPFDSGHVITNWGDIIAYMANDGINPAANYYVNMQIFPTKFQIGNLVGF
jgi:hypothetical protein